MPKESKTKIMCAFCGAYKPLEEFADRAHGKASFCLDCEQKYFDRISKESGLHLALFACCAAFNVPFLPLILNEGIEKSKDKWLFYLKLLKKKNYVEQNGQMLTFFDGGTNILKLFGRKLDDKTTAKYIEAETIRLQAFTGTEKQREMWGTVELLPKLPMEQGIYDELDRMYNAKAGEYKGSTLSAQQQDVIIKVCKWNYMINVLLQRGQYAYAEKLQRMVQSELAAECMRKQDEKPVELMRIDATVDYLEKAGLMEDGQFLTYDEILNVFMKWYRSKKYDYSVDVADQMIFKTQNAARANADLPLWTDLPEEYMITDNFGEFEPEETEIERKAKEFAGLSPIVRTRKKKKGGGE